MIELTTPCPKCRKAALILHSAGRICGCLHCLSIYRYPSMTETGVNVNRYHATTYTNPRRSEYWFEVVERMTGKIIHTSASYPTLAEAEESARRLVAEKERRADEEEQDYQDYQASKGL